MVYIMMLTQVFLAFELAGRACFKEACTKRNFKIIRTSYES